MIFPDTLDYYIGGESLSEKESQNEIIRNEFSKRNKYTKRLIIVLTIVSLIFIVVSVVLISLIWTTIGYSVQSNQHISLLSSLQNEVAETLGISSKSDVLPKLVLHLTIDALRHDNIHVFRKRFGKSGFNFLFDGGTYYQNALYDYANTFTAVGHASIFTCSPSRVHGIVANHWYTPGKGEFRACEDSRYTREVSDMEPSPLVDSSPVNLLSSTYGDELISRSPSSKYFSISMKNRAAIMSGGHRGKSLWFSAHTGRFITSNYYYTNEYPGWVTGFNKKMLSQKYSRQEWELSYPSDEYLFGEGFISPDRGHKFKGEFKDPIRCTPFGDRLLLDFAKELLENEELGKRDQVDILAISFSVLDCIGHKYGVASKYYEDAIYKIDSYLEELFEFIQSYIGLKNTLIVLDGDHGMDLGLPYHKDELGVKAEVIVHLKEELNEYLNEKYDLVDDDELKDLVLGQEGPGLYIDVDKIKDSPDIFDYDEIVEEVKKYVLENKEVVSFVYTRKEILEGRLPNTEFSKLLYNAYHATRSGDLYVVTEQFSQLMAFHTKTSTHGSPYSYDRHVPIFIYGNDIPRGRIIGRKVTPLDIAPTISAYYGINYPSGCTGKPLEEVLKVHKVNY